MLAPKKFALLGNTICNKIGPDAATDGFIFIFHRKHARRMIERCISVLFSFYTLAAPSHFFESRCSYLHTRSMYFDISLLQIAFVICELQFAVAASEI